MIRLSATFDSEETVRSLERIPGWLDDQLESLTAKAAKGLVGYLKQHAPVSKPQPDSKTSPGRLRDSIRAQQDGPVSELYAVGYAEFVIGGTSPHEIAAKTAPVLAFYWERVGAMAFYKSVHHPGTRPNDFRQPAIDEAAGDAEDLLAGLADELANRL